MASNDQLFSPGDAELLIKGSASTLDTIAFYLHYRFSDGLVTQTIQQQMYKLVGSCAGFLKDDEYKSMRHELKNALYDIVQICAQSILYFQKVPIDYLKTLCEGSDDKRATNTQIYACAALSFAVLITDLFPPAGKTKGEIESMNSNAWNAYKNILLMRLTIVEQWQDTLSKLSEPCQNAVRASAGDEKAAVKSLRTLFRAVDADRPLDVKVEAV